MAAFSRVVFAARQADCMKKPSICRRNKLLTFILEERALARVSKDVPPPGARAPAVALRGALEERAHPSG